jgi:sporulation protein YabP
MEVFFIMEQKATNAKALHNLTLNSRENLSINGVKEILNFDENSVCLKTDYGDLSIEGNSIRIDILNIETGNVVMRGKINSIYYYDSISADKHSLLSKIFK